MSNWCENNLTVTGPEEHLAAFKERAQSGKCPLSFAQFIPYPENFAQLDRATALWLERHTTKGPDCNPIFAAGLTGRDIPIDGFNSGGYEWCMEHWGTKLDLSEDNVSLETLPGSLEYSFDTAWTPPRAAVWGMSKMFPQLSFLLSYGECGNNFSGRFIARVGNVELDASGAYGDYGGNIDEDLIEVDE